MTETMLPATTEPDGAVKAVMEVATVAAAARERYELETAYVMAARFPRRASLVRADCVAMSQSRAMARPQKGAWYAYPRGGKTISGPTVKLARAMAARWGHIDTGIKVLSLSEDECHVEGYAHDRQTGVSFRRDARFPLLVQRKTGWEKPDARDQRNLIGTQGAYLQRNCILDLLPPDLVEDCLDAARRAAAGEIDRNLEVERAEALTAWRGLGISQERLEERLGCKLEETSGDQLAELLALFFGIKSKETTLAAVFPPRAAEVDEGAVTAGKAPAARE